MNSRVAKKDITCNKCNTAAVGTHGHIGKKHRKCPRRTGGKLVKVADGDYMRYAITPYENQGTWT